jgi:hypothetical protein
MWTWGGQTDSVHLMYCFLYAEACIGTYIFSEYESSIGSFTVHHKFSAPKVAFIHYSMDLPTEVIGYQKCCENDMFHIVTPVVEIF